MTTLTRFIQFRAFVDSMNETEALRLIASIMKQCGKDAILKPFCNQLLQDIHRNTDQLNVALNASNNIIISKEKSEQISSKVTIESLSSTLIGEIASYLEQNSHISLSQANRIIYIGCNNTNTLRKLDLESIKNYSCIKLAQYPRLKCLRVKLSKFKEFKFPNNVKILQNLTKLEFDGDEFVGDVGERDIDPLLHQKSIDFTKISYLQLRDVGAPENKYPLDKFKILMSLFPNITMLSLRDTHLDITSGDEINVKQLFPKLTGFDNWSHSNDILTNQIIREFGPELQSFHVKYDNNIVIPSNVKFSKLEELYLCTPTSIDVMNDLLDRTTSLKRLKLQNNEHIIANPQDWNKLMRSIFMTQNSLNYFMIVERSAFHFFDAIGDGLEYGLYGISDKNRRMRMKIIYGSNSASDTSTIEASKIFMQADRIRTQLTASFGQRNFVLTLHHKPKWNGDKDVVKEMVKSFNQRYGEEIMVHNEISDDSVILTMYPFHIASSMMP